MELMWYSVGALCLNFSKGALAFCFVYSRSRFLRQGESVNMTLISLYIFQGISFMVGLSCY